MLLKILLELCQVSYIWQIVSQIPLYTYFATLDKMSSSFFLDCTVYRQEFEQFCHTDPYTITHRGGMSIF